MSITKTKAGTYKVRVYMGKTLEGKNDVRQITCKTMREARREETRLRAEKDATRGKSGRMTLSAYVDGWYRPIMGRLARSSRETYERELRLRILPALGNVDVRDIDRARVQRMVDGCETERVASKALSVLKTVLNEARNDGIIVTNPATLKYRLPPRGRRRDNGLVIGTFAQMRPLFDALEAWDADGTCSKLAATGLLMGLRPEERYGLDWEDFHGETVHVQRAYLQVTGGHDLKPPKTANGDRLVPVPKQAAAIVGRWRVDGNVIQTGALMKGPDGRRLSPSTGQKRWARFLRDNPQVPQVTIENMRHSFATSFLAAGGNVENLSRILGHADINTTYKRYVRPTADNLIADMSRVAI